MLVMAGAYSLFSSFVKPFWYDEVCTVIVSRLSTGTEMWNALEQAADTNPPLYYLLTHFARQLVGDDHIGYRLPSIVGLLGAITCLYAFLSKKVSHLAALAGAASVLCFLSLSYADEARPYAVMLGCVAAAMLAWQRMDDSRASAFALAVALAAAVSVHYYALFVWPAFGLAEAVVWRLDKRFRVGAWAAWIAGLTPFLFFGHMLLNLRRAYGQNFWARPGVSQMLSAQDGLFTGNGHWGFTLAFGISVLLAALWLRERMGWMPGQDQRAGLEERILPTGDSVLAMGLLWIPMVATAAALISHGGMTTRYMLPAVLGGAAMIGFLADRLSGRARMLLLLLLLVNFGMSFVSKVKAASKNSLLEQRTSSAQELQHILAAAHEPELPVVIASGLDYLPMAYYTPPDIGRRLYLITDPPAALRYSGSDSIDLALLILRRYAPLQVEDYSSFSSRHRQFLLVVHGGDGFDWWPWHLLHEGHSLELRGRVGRATIYAVTLRGASGNPGNGENSAIQRSTAARSVGPQHTVGVRH